MAAKKVYQRTLQQTTSGYPGVVSRESKIQEIVRRRNKGTLADEIASSKFCYVNWLCEALKKAYPMSPRDWTVSRFYPASPDGPICIDEVHNEQDRIRFITKGKIVREAGLRYVCISPRTDISDALGEVIA